MLTISVDPDQLAMGLESWTWLGLSGLTPILVSVLGDVFFVSPSGVVMLDTIEGRLVKVAENPESLHTLLETPEGQDELLLAGLVLEAQRQLGRPLKPGECLDFKIPPALGGEMTPEALHPMDFAVKLNIAGQIHRQIKDLPPGTPVGKITIDEP